MYYWAHKKEFLMGHPDLRNYAVYDQFDSLAEAARLGWFSPETRETLPVPEGMTFNPPITDLDSEVHYFPGSFGTFHDGHISVVEHMRRIASDNAVIVIAPSHSSYNCVKYGEWSERAANKARYKAIRAVIERERWTNVIIDTAPMLCGLCDQNFPDLARNFMTRNNMRGVPTVWVGKDHADWLELNGRTDMMKVAFAPDSTGVSTSNTPAPQREKKTAWVRARTREQFELFRQSFSDQYRLFVYQSMDQERQYAREVASEFDYTICKDYADILPYVKFSRTFANPLDDPIFPEIPEVLHGKRVLDSDIYTGATAAAIEATGGWVQAILAEVDPDYIEIIDIDDFLKPDFTYPKYDISERCSMQAFNLEFHKRYETFRSQLRALEETYHVA